MLTYALISHDFRAHQNKIEKLHVIIQHDTQFRNVDL